ncbi:MAG: CAP domain-containing protein [Actinomycetota bacterium]
MRVRHAIALVLITATLATPSAAFAGARARAGQMRWTMFHLVNNARRNHGLDPLAMDARLSRTAHRHSMLMAARRTVFHTANLYDTVRRYRPNRWGENVGMAGTVRRLHRAFMASAEHRANILGTAYRRVGVGIVRSGGRVWGTLIFYG